MSLAPLVSAVVAAGYEEQPLPVSSVVFPLVAIGVFALLGIVTWSYRDVANRFADKMRGDSGQSH